jgi:hypothetical protein
MAETQQTDNAEISNEMAEAGAAALRFHLVYEQQPDFNQGRLEQIAREVFVAMRAALEQRDGTP